MDGSRYSVRPVAIAVDTPSEPPAPTQTPGIKAIRIYNEFKDDVVYYDTGERFLNPPWIEEGRKVLAPRGRPNRGEPSSKFYKELAELYRDLATAGQASPSKR